MPVDPKLRDVLDTLDEAPANARPAEDRELLLSVLRRLELRDHVRHRPRPMPVAEINAEREEAARRQAELEQLAREQSLSSDALRQLQAERDALVARQEELEDRLAQLEAASHGGSLSYVEDSVQPQEPVVEFSRVNLDEIYGGSQEELMEFEDVGSAFDEPAPAAWQRPSDGDVSWDSRARSEPAAHVDWDEESDWSAAPAADQLPQEPMHDDEEVDTWETEGDEEPTWQPATAAAPQSPEAWGDDDEEQTWAPAAEEKTPWAPPATNPVDTLDEKTRQDLAALEAQLAELEAELAKRPKRSEPRDE